MGFWSGHRAENPLSIDRLRAILDANGVARMNERSFDIVVIGAGVAGREAARRLADAGLSVAIVEADLVGGECPFWACMPSKALLRPGEALAEARRIPGAAEAATGDLDVEAVLARRDDVIHHLEDSSYLPGFETAASSSCDSKGVWTALAVCAPGTTSSLRARP